MNNTTSILNITSLGNGNLVNIFFKQNLQSIYNQFHVKLYRLNPELLAGNCGNK